MSNEAHYNQMVKRAIRKLGIYTYKTSDRANAGVPDIYAVGGNWIEGKLIPMPTLRAITILSRIDPAQKIFMNGLTLGGDNCLVACYFFNEHGIRYFMLVPWTHMRAVISWRIQDIHHFAIPVDSKVAGDRLQMDRYFGKDYFRHYSQSWWNGKWDAWAEPNKGRWTWPTTAMPEEDDNEE